jgi:hypothetical protein
LRASILFKVCEFFFKCFKALLGKGYSIQCNTPV